MVLGNWQDVIDKDWPEMSPVTEETVNAYIQAGRCGVRLSAREATG